MSDAERPKTHYAQVGDGYVAYQVVGDGPVDLVFHHGWYSHIDMAWDVPAYAHFLRRLASFSRLIVFDRRGHGMSDPIDLNNITLEQWMEDLSAVMEAAGSERAVLAGGTEAGPMQILHAATFPERTAALVLFNASACFARRDDYPIGLPEWVRQVAADQMLELMIGGNDNGFAAIAPDRAEDPDWQERTMRMVRYATSPAMIRRLMWISMEQDVRDILPSVRVPTLVLHRTDQPFVRVGHGRYLAEHIEGAKLVELPGTALMPFDRGANSVLDEIEEFVTGVRPIAEPDRVLATVFFTDLVESTERAVQVGDRRWGDLLAAHNRIVRREIERHRGREVNTAGDGFLATFDGPARAVRCACSIVDAVRAIGLDVRAGVHTGEVEFSERDVAGIAVHIGSRVSDLAWPGEVLVSRTVVDLVAGSELAFAERGSHTLKGVPGEWQLYAVER